MGEPQNPDAAQIAVLENAGQLQTLDKTQKIKVADGKIVLQLTMPQQAVTLLKLNW
jgi:xylan 1,4-beta-xylosidase